MFRQPPLKRTSRLNIVALMLMLLIVSGRCSAAMDQLSTGDAAPALAAAEHAHCAEMNTPPDTIDAGPCWDNHCPAGMASLLSSSAKAPKQSPEHSPWVALLPGYLPLVRAGPCPRLSSPPTPADYPATPLYYAHCVLRL